MSFFRHRSTLSARPSAVRRGVVALAAAPLLALAACGNGGGTGALEGDGGGEGEGGGGAVTIAHQNFTEMTIMAELYADVLEAAGYEPELKALGDRSLYVGQLADGNVDVAVEYLSSMTEFLNKEVNGPDAEPVASSSAEETLGTLTELGEQQGLTPLEPSQAEDANAFAVTREFSEANDVTTLSDLGELGEPVALAAAPDCPDRQDCLLGLESVYGIDIADFQPLGFGTPQTKDALQKDEVQVGQVGTSDGQLEQLDLVVLEDDKDWQNAENLVPVLNAEFAEANPDAVAALDELSATLTTEDLMRLNAQVDAERMLPEDVAAEYLQEKGLV